MLDYAKNHIAALAVESVWAQEDRKNFFFFKSNPDGIVLSKNQSSRHEFVSLDDSGRLVGFIRYSLYNNYATNMEIISFVDGSSIFAKDLIEVCKNAFSLFGVSGISGSINLKHPLLSKYLSIMKKHNAKIYKDEKQKFYFFTIYKQ